MKFIIERSRYLSILAVITLLLTFTLAMLWGIVQAVQAWRQIIVTFGQSPDIILYILKLIDTFLVVMVVYILAASIYKLFVSDVELPSMLVANSLPELKSKLSSVIVLVMAVHFVEVMFEQGVTGMEKLWEAIAISIVSIVLIAFSYFGGSHTKDKSSK